MPWPYLLGMDGEIGQSGDNPSLPDRKKSYDDALHDVWKMFRRWLSILSCQEDIISPDIARSVDATTNGQNDLQIKIELVVPQLLCSLLEIWQLWKREEVYLS